MYDEIKKNVPPSKYKIKDYFDKGEKLIEKCDQQEKCCGFIEESSYIGK